MRWNCPHCSIELYIEDGRIGNGWSFARCYGCSGYSLVRKSNVNTIRIDEAPTPGNTLQPKPVTVQAPPHVQAAMNQLGQARGQIQSTDQKRPQVIPGRRGSQQPQTIATNAARAVQHQQTPVRTGAGAKLGGKVISLFSQKALPAPLPEQPIATAKPRNRAAAGILPIALGITAVMAVASGVFLYVQGQEMWDNARTALNTEDHGSDSLNLVARHPHGKKQAAAQDSIGHSSMAPDHTIKDGGASIALQNQAQTPATAPSTASDNSSINSRVRPIQNSVKLRMGPGTKYPIVGHADPTITYTVLASKEQWFKVVPNVGPRDEAWIRNDYVRTE